MLLLCGWECPVDSCDASFQPGSQSFASGAYLRIRDGGDGFETIIEAKWRNRMDLKVEARNVEMRKGWQKKIDEEKEKLTRHFANFVLHLRVSIEATTHHKEGGYELKMVASVPNDTVVVAKKGENVGPLLVEAFDVLSLQLKEMLRKKRQLQKGADTAFDDGTRRGVIRKVSPYESYGFIVSQDARDIYFHENALKDISIDSLAEGDEVTFGESHGDKGPQASWVRVGR